jgi:hypothetical protein
MALNLYAVKIKQEGWSGLVASTTERQARIDFWTVVKTMDVVMPYRFIDVTSQLLMKQVEYAEGVYLGKVDDPAWVHEWYCTKESDLGADCNCVNCKAERQMEVWP